jgi:hypothetical protein
VEVVEDGNADGQLEITAERAAVLAEAAIVMGELGLPKALAGRAVHLERIAGYVVRGPLENHEVLFVVDVRQAVERNS